MSDGVGNLVSAIQFTTAAKAWTSDISEMLKKVQEVCIDGGLGAEFNQFEDTYRKVTDDIKELMLVRHLADMRSVEARLAINAIDLFATLEALFERAQYKTKTTSSFKFFEKKKARAISEQLIRALADLGPNLVDVLKARGMVPAK